MNPLLKVLKILAAGTDVLRSGARKVVPAEEELILRNIKKSLPEILAKIESTGGFSFNPRTGRFMEGGSDFGNMMATVPERINALGKSLNRTAPDVTAVERLISDPYYMDRLRKGQYLGGWVDETGNLALDPSQRFINRNRSIVKGGKANQEGGFDMYNTAFYPSGTDELLQAERRQRARRRALAALLASVPIASQLEGEG